MKFQKFTSGEKRIFLIGILLFVVFYGLRLASGIYTLSDSNDYLYTSRIIFSGEYFGTDTD